MYNESPQHLRFNQTSDGVVGFDPRDFDVVVSCCGCGPKLGAPWRDHPGFEDWALDDPPQTDPGDLSEYRRVRDECQAKCVELLSRPTLNAQQQAEAQVLTKRSSQQWNLMSAPSRTCSVGRLGGGQPGREQRGRAR